MTAPTPLAAASTALLPNVTTRSIRKLSWKLTAAGVGMVLLHFTFILPIMNGYPVSGVSLVLAVGATYVFLRVWNARGNAIEQLAASRADAALGAARLNNPIANWTSTWPVLALLTAPVTILLLIAIIGPP